MASTLAKLRIQLSADDAELRKALGSSERALKAHEKKELARQKRIRAARVAAARAVASSTAVVVAAYLSATKSAIGFADSIAKNAHEVGLLAREYDALQSAAMAAGVDQSKFNVSMRTLNRTLGEAAQGIGEARATYAALGIEIRNADGTLKSNRQVLGEVSTALAGVEDHTLKAAYANKIFGESGSRMLTLLSKGNTALVEQEKLMRDLGATMSDETAAKAELLQTKMDLLGDVMRTSLSTDLIEAADRTLPYFISFADKMVWLGRAIAIGWAGTVKRFAKFPLVIGAAIKAGGDTLTWFMEFFANAWHNVPIYTKVAMVKMKKAFVDGFAYMEQAVAKSALARKFFGIDGDNLYFAGMSEALGTELKAVEELLSTQLADTVLDPNFISRLGGSMVEGTSSYIDGLNERITTLKALMGGEGPATAVNNAVDNANGEGAVAAGQDKVTEATKMTMEQETKLQNMRRQTTQMTLGFLKQQVKGGSGAAKAIMAAMTALNIAQILSNTEVAKMRALAELGPVAGPPMAAAIQGQGMISVGIAAAQGVSGMFHDGIDNVPNTGTYLLEKGERVVDRRLNEDLTQALAGGAGGVGASPSFHFAFDGKVSKEDMAEMMGNSKDIIEQTLRDINSDRAGQGLI